MTLIAHLQQPRDRPAMDAHFAALSDEDRRYRFGYPIKPEALAAYLDGLANDEALAYGVFNPAGELVALAQLGVAGEALEIGLSVLPDYRRQGLGTALMTRSASYARSRGIHKIVLLSLADNHPIIALARRHGMAVSVSHGEAESAVRVEHGTALDYWREVAFDQAALLQSVTRSWMLAASRLTHRD